MEADTAVDDMDGVNGYYYRKSCHSKHKEDDNEHLEEAQEHVTWNGNISFDDNIPGHEREFTRPIHCSGSGRMYINRFA